MVRASSYSQFTLTERSDRFQIELDGLPAVEVALRPSGFRTRRIESRFLQRRLFTDCPFGCNYDCRCVCRCDGLCQGEEDGSCRGDCDWCFNPYDPKEWFPYLGPNLLAAQGTDLGRRLAIAKGPSTALFQCHEKYTQNAPRADQAASHVGYSPRQIPRPWLCRKLRFSRPFESTRCSWIPDFTGTTIWSATYSRTQLQGSLPPSHLR